MDSEIGAGQLLPLKKQATEVACENAALSRAATLLRE
jgi:hypothetical protein